MVLNSRVSFLCEIPGFFLIHKTDVSLTEKGHAPMKVFCRGRLRDGDGRKRLGDLERKRQRGDRLTEMQQET